MQILIASTVVGLTWFGLHLVNKWWKSGTARFTKIMEEELS
jgi:hypothetical protein